MKKIQEQGRFFLLIFTVLLAGCLAILFNGCAKKNDDKYSGRIKPGSPVYIMNEGIFYLNSGNMAMAEKKLTRALEKKPTLVPAINALGIVYLNKRDFDKALKKFRQVVSTNPTYYDAYNYLGIIYSEKGQYNLAKENLLIAANAPKYRTPENAFANLAQLEIRQKKYNSAKRYVEKGLQKNGRFAQLHNLMGAVLEHQRDYAGALGYYEKALRLLTQGDVTYMINIGRVCLKLGNKNKALDILEKALPMAYLPQQKVRIREMIKEVEKR